MSQKVNIGTARYWILVHRKDIGMPVLIDASNRPPGDLMEGFECIDRGPINQWTGEPHE